MSIAERLVWVLVVLFKEFLSDFVRRIAELAAEKVSRAKALYRKRRK